MLVLVNLTFSRERSCYVLNFHAFIIYQIQETCEENVLRLTCQDLGPSGSSGHGDDASQELLRTAVCDPSLHIGLAFFTCFKYIKLDYWMTIKLVCLFDMNISVIFLFLYGQSSSLYSSLVNYYSLQSQISTQICLAIFDHQCK